jgi:hypothetical protein
MVMSRSVRTRILYGVLGLLGVNALLGLIVVFAGSLSGTGGKVIGSSFLIAGGCLLALAGSTVLERARLIAVATIFSNALACVLLLALIWGSESGDGLARVTVAACCVSVYGSVASLLISKSRGGGAAGARWPRALALAAFGILALLGVFGAAGAVDGSGGAWQVAGAAAILGIFGVIAIPIMRAVNRAGGEMPSGRPRDLTVQPADLEDLVGLRVVAIKGAERDVLVFENGARVRSS